MVTSLFRLVSFPSVLPHLVPTPFVPWLSLTVPTSSLTLYQHYAPAFLLSHPSAVLPVPTLFVPWLSLTVPTSPCTNMMPPHSFFHNYQLLLPSPHSLLVSIFTVHSPNIHSGPLPLTSGQGRVCLNNCDLNASLLATGV